MGTTRGFLGALIGDSTQGLFENSYMGGCQNYSPFLDPYDNTAPNI